ncbi:MAG: phosphatidate cytidylyltransferase [Verrucomicrobiota bacterium]
MGPAFKVFLSRLTSSLSLWGVCAATMYWANEPGFWALLGILVLRGLWEFFQMLSAAGLPHFKGTGMFLGGVLCFGSLFCARTWNCDTAVQFESAVVALSVLWIFIRQIARKSPEPLPITTIAYTVLGLFYIPFLGTFASKLLYISSRAADGTITGHYYLLFLAVVTKFSDCGAYLTGSLIGKHPMIPHISPKKTWEGFAGALALSTLGAFVLLKVFPTQLSLITPIHGLILGLIFSVMAVLGDLAESVVKRSTGIKDSGHFLPGIGGAMDLIDSLLFTGPLLYFYLHFVIGSR